MNDSVALNEVVRVLGTELGKHNERVLIGSTEEEKAVLQKHATSGKRRAVAGLAVGSAIGGGVWKALSAQRRILGGLTMTSSGLAGFMYGMLSIRRGLFEEILSLPSEKSPFAARAREVLDEKLPQNPFYLEIKEILKKHERNNGSWDSMPVMPTSKSGKLDEGEVSFPGYGGSSTASPRMPRLPRLPQQEDTFNNTNDNSSELGTTDSASSSPSSSPFFFGGSSASTDSTSSPSDSFGSAPPPAAKPQQDDPYYSDDGWGDEDKNEKPKPVTWEELRRRAASGKQ